jgi:septum site-determining protein MinC
MDNITIKGNKNGITVYINSGSFADIRKELLDKINDAREFFTGCSMNIVDNDGLITETNFNNLKIELKENYEVFLVNFKEEKASEAKEKYYTGIYEGKTKFYRNTIRSGQRINYMGNIVIIGDVNSGAEVTAAGNIVVLGVLRGVAHAGFNGNKRAFVAAYKLLPSQLRIADIITRAPDDRIEKPVIPEVAKIKDSDIIIEPYLPNKYL